MFKAGDRVEIVDVAGIVAPHSFKAGDVLTVDGTGGGFVRVTDPQGRVFEFSERRFVVSEMMDTPPKSVWVVDTYKTNGGVTTTTYSGPGWVNTPSMPVVGVMAPEAPVVSSTGGVKMSKGKLQFRLFLPEFLKSCVTVLTKGAEKYPSVDNWKKNDPEQYVDALERHWNEYRLGNKMDDGPGGTGESHLTCVGINAMFLWFFQMRGGK